MTTDSPSEASRREPAFDMLPTATEIAHWYAEEMKDERNVGGDAWWLSRDPHSSCRRLAMIDWDTQCWVLLDIATSDSKDLLLVSHGLDGLWADWWQHPVSTRCTDPTWERDGVAWLADQLVVHLEYREMHRNG